MLQITPDVTSITGTTNQVTASSPNGAVTLSTPQNIDTASAFQSNSLQLNSNGTVSIPSLLLNDTDTGFYTPAEGQIGISVDGVQAMQINPQSSSNGPFIGLFGTAPTTTSYITSTVTSTGSSLGAFFKVSFTYSAALALAAYIAVLDFTTVSTKDKPVRTISSTATMNAAGATSDTASFYSVPGVGSSFTISAGSINLIGHDFVPATGASSANYTGGTINVIAHSVPAVPGGYTGHGVTLNYYALKSAAGYLSHLGGVISGRTAVADVAYTVLQYDYIIAYTSLTATRIVTLPAPSATNSGQVFIIKDESGSAAAGVKITVTPASGTIDGAANVSIAAAYGVVRCYNNGVNYYTQ
ncbi:MAG: hypothetical protein ACYDBV_13175 [Nitrospiria bacterium]